MCIRVQPTCRPANVSHYKNGTCARPQLNRVVFESTTGLPAQALSLGY